MSQVIEGQTSQVVQSPQYNELISRIKEAHLLGSTSAILGWDQEVMMPEQGLAHRIDQMAQIAQLHHQKSTDPKIGKLLDFCEANPELNQDPISDTAVNIREIRRDYTRAVCLPEELVIREARITSQAKHEWARARKEDDFSRFEPHLQNVVDLNIEKAKCFGYAETGEPWDALAEGFQAGCTAKYVEGVFVPLREQLVAFLKEIKNAPKAPTNDFNKIKLPVDQQEAFVRDVATQIGFNFDAGRLDSSVHPFCSGTHPGDVRLTTRFHEDNVNDALGSTMHESGHGIYEQGLPAGSAIGTPMGTSVSLSVHESQSRLWENQVGRSNAFWDWCHPKLNDHFGDACNHLTKEQIVGGANIVSPSLVRVEADEATYNLHIMIRFDIERDLMSGKITAKDVSAIWNEKYKTYLGVDVPSDSLGCLQDIHWSMGAIGYFPTYTLGTLYAAQYFDAAKEAIPDLDQQIANGEFANLKTWLNENIHQQGNRYNTQDLCEKVTGKPLSAQPMMDYLEAKIRPLYGI